MREQETYRGETTHTKYVTHTHTSSLPHHQNTNVLLWVGRGQAYRYRKRRRPHRQAGRRYGVGRLKQVQGMPGVGKGWGSWGKLGARGLA